MASTEFIPRWQKSRTSADCEVQECRENACRLSGLAGHVNIEKLLNLSLQVPGSSTTVTHLCDGHYRGSHKVLNPQNYQNKCVTCDLVIRATTYTRHCPNPDLVENTFKSIQALKVKLVLTIRFVRHAIDHY